MKNINIGSYVLATKYSDGDTKDHWCVGFFSEVLDYEDHKRYQVVYSGGKAFRDNGFRKMKKITREEGYFFVENSKIIEQFVIGIWQILWRLRKGRLNDEIRVLRMKELKPVLHDEFVD